MPLCTRVCVCACVRVCAGPSLQLLSSDLLPAGNNLQLLSILTGVTIVDVGEETRLLFSCYPQERHLGGVGLIKLSRDRKRKEILPVTTGSESRALAGSLFHVNLVSDTCSFDPQPHICLPHAPAEMDFPDPTTPVPEPEGGDNTVSRYEEGGEVEETKSASGKGGAAPSAVRAASRWVALLVTSLVLCAVRL